MVILNLATECFTNSYLQVGDDNAGVILRNTQYAIQFPLCFDFI